MLMPGENDNISEYYEPHKDEEYRIDKQDIEGDYKDLVGKSLDFGSYAKDSLSERTPQNRLFASESSLSLRKIKFS